jgi:hypothetical protein
MATTSLVSVERSITQSSRRKVLAVWAAAALPMAVLAWVVAPALAGPGRFAETLIYALCAALVWQFVLVMILVRGQRWRDALWLRPPSTATRSGGRLWLWALPFLAGFLAVQFLPLHLPTVAGHDSARSSARTPVTRPCAATGGCSPSSS